MELDFDVSEVVRAATEVGARRVALQFPEGLLARAWELAAKIEAASRGTVETVVLGEPAFGSCCADDVLARSLGAQLLVHFGHSRVVPRAVTDAAGRFAVLYVAVTASWDIASAAAAIATGLPPSAATVALVTTAQFLLGLPKLAALLEHEEDDKQRRRITAVLPRSGQLLAPGEILGCTAPRLSPNAVDAIVFVGDGRFHVEAAAIGSPSVETFRYDPYTLAFTRETLDTAALRALRERVVETARRNARFVGIAISTLGRQASPASLRTIERLLDIRGIPHMAVLLDDVSPTALARFEGVDTWVQLACPRLSIDWSSDFATPLLTSHEAIIAFSQTTDIQQSPSTPMDNWDSG